jgi:hypothetical protein
MNDDALARDLSRYALLMFLFAIAVALLGLTARACESSDATPAPVNVPAPIYTILPPCAETV